MCFCLPIVNFYLLYNFWTVRDIGFIFGTHILSMMPFLTEITFSDNVTLTLKGLCCHRGNSITQICLLILKVATVHISSTIIICVASQQGTLTLPDTWFRLPFLDLLMLQLLRPVLPNLPCLFSTFHLEYSSVLSRFCLYCEHKNSGNEAITWFKS